MQTLQEQRQLNAERLDIYRKKLDAGQQRLARVAERVAAYSKKLGLNLPQYNAAIRLAQAQLKFGCSEDDAFKAGAGAVRIIALASAGQRLGSIHRRNIFRLH